MGAETRPGAPALDQSGPAYFLIGGSAARSHVSLLTKGYHQSGACERELRTLVDHRKAFIDGRAVPRA